tara:strand:+ start:1433 stop:2095 length:663 start_codon:yes stop_codon:yes gene_type:complete
MRRTHIYGLLAGDKTSPTVQARYGQVLDAQVGALTNIIDRAKSRIELIRKDRGLNPMGVAEQIAEEGRAALREIDTLSAGRIQKMESDAEVARAALPVRVPLPEGVKDRTTITQELIEIRTFLGSIDAIDRPSFLKQAAARGEGLPFLAIQNAPSMIAESLIPEPKFAKIREEYLRTAYPDSFEFVDTVDDATLTFKSNTGTAKITIAKEAGVMVNPPGE